MLRTVEKIGGTSIADTEVIVENVLIGNRQDKELYNRIFVVSAYSGMTNLLLEHKKSGAPGVFSLFAGAGNKWVWTEALSSVAVAMEAKNAEIFAGTPERDIADTFIRERIEEVRNCLIDLHRLCAYGQFRLDENLATVKEVLSSLGEAHSAFNTALLLRQRGVRATFVDLTGWRDGRSLTLEERMEDALEGIDLSQELPIVTGYASCPEGLVRQFGRGYTEVTFARLAAMVGADEAIIHKEFHLSSADPKLVGPDKVRKIGSTNFDVADQLSNMGMEAVHPKAAKTLRQSGIRLRVKNTFDSLDEGTVISVDYIPDAPRADIVTGMKGIFALEVFDQDMVGEKGYDASVLDALTRHSIRIVSKCSNANTITHYVDCSRKALKRATADIESALKGAKVSVSRVAIVSVIGADIDVPGITARALGALHNAGIPLAGLQQVSRKTDIQAVIAEDDFDAAIRALHRALVEDEVCPGVQERRLLPAA
ncbi:MAG: aspartate kinase [Hyphomonas sp.]|uniref:aspartate kinase n=1 Tax=Hyphomonas sp. TaxID=87 RepID=UPI001798059E|nr:aspartate kinase [Hyphomonas sp.]MBA3069225.1 aspartate kinase [Hyphomonas sp.]MBU3919213.1 aspartate kinase [Alphaproteobacteria bacterium]MBU4061828.1 aspartate kinase [Alphaproteobacteria bacterium]MBU4163340.1 aspartate kinase [Alphaproteobacteria bacterium]